LIKDMFELSVLIVEDDDVLQQLLRLQLEDYPDISILAIAATAEDGLRICEERRPDAAIVDLRLPGMSGEELMALLHARYPGIRLVGYSSSPLASSAQALRRIGVRIVDKGNVSDLVAVLRGRDAIGDAA